MQIAAGVAGPRHPVATVSLKRICPFLYVPFKTRGIKYQPEGIDLG